MIDSGKCFGLRAPIATSCHCPIPIRAMKKIRPKSLMREVAYDRFKVELFKRNLAPGQFVSQVELCELLDVPLGPTREALKRLEAESLVRLIPQRGIQIADIGVR